MPASDVSGMVGEGEENEVQQRRAAPKRYRVARLGQKERGPKCSLQHCGVLYDKLGDGRGGPGRARQHVALAVRERLGARKSIPQLQLKRKGDALIALGNDVQARSEQRHL